MELLTVSTPPTNPSLAALAMCGILEVSPTRQDFAAQIGLPFSWSNSHALTHWLESECGISVSTDRLVAMLPALTELFRQQLASRLH